MVVRYRTGHLSRCAGFSHNRWLKTGKFACRVCFQAPRLEDPRVTSVGRRTSTGGAAIRMNFRTKSSVCCTECEWTSFFIQACRRASCSRRRRRRRGDGGGSSNEGSAPDCYSGVRFYSLFFLRSPIRWLSFGLPNTQSDRAAKTLLLFPRLQPVHPSIRQSVSQGVSESVA